MLDSDWGWGTTRPVTLSFRSIGRPWHCRSPPTNGCFRMAAPLLYSADKLWLKSINYLFLPKCVWNNWLAPVLCETCCCCCFLCVFLSPHISSPTSPNVPPLPFFCVLPLFFQSLQWRDWKLVWWRTLATPPMKRKTTQPLKPQGQVTLGQFPPPPPPQAGHRAIAALLHHPLVLKRSRSQCLSGWHPKTRKISIPQCFVPSLTGCSPQTEPVFSQNPSFITWMTLYSYMLVAALF